MSDFETNKNNPQQQQQLSLGVAGGESATYTSTLDSSSGTSMSGSSGGLGASGSAGASAGGADGGGRGTPLSEEEIAAVVSEQPTGEAPSAEEMEGRRKEEVNSSADNFLPTDKLENGLKHAKMMISTGWMSFASSVRDLENSETYEKLREGTVTMIDKSLDGLSKVGCKVVEVTDKGVQAVGAKMEEAAPTVGRWRDEVVIASERSFAAAKEMTDKAMTEMKRPGTGPSSAAGSWGGGPVGGGGSSGGDASSGNANPSPGKDGPHTV